METIVENRVGPTSTENLQQKIQDLEKRVKELEDAKENLLRRLSDLEQERWTPQV